VYYKPDHFELYELVPEEIYRRVSHDKLWQCFDPKLLWTQEQLRLKYGKMVCNTWWWGGGNQYRGYRTPYCEIGAEWSLHKFFRALDSVPTDYSVEKIRQDIMEAKEKKDQGIYQYITCIEVGVSWLHFDTRNYDGLLLVYP